MLAPGPTRSASAPCFSSRDLLVELVERAGDVGPFEADLRGALAELVRARQRRQRERHIGQHARACSLARSRRFCSSHATVCAAALSIVRVAEHMRMTPFHLVADRMRPRRRTRTRPARSPSARETRPGTADRRARRAALRSRRARSHPRLRTPLRSCTARSSRRSARRSHGQPRCGSRSRAMMSSRRVMDDMGISLSALQQSVQRHQHSGRGAPDVVLAVRDVVHCTVVVAERALARLVIGRVEDVRQRNLERRSRPRCGSSSSSKPGCTKPTTGVTQKPVSTRCGSR